MAGLLTEEALIKVIEDIKSNGKLPDSLNSPISQVIGLSEGNINQVFRVLLTNQQSFIVKYAPPFAYRYQEIAIAHERNGFEANVTQKFKSRNSDNYPEIYLFDAEKSLLLMQDLSHCSVMRDSLIQGQIFPRFANHVVKAMSFYPHNIPEKQAPENIRFTYAEGIPELQNITKDFVFEHPFGLAYPQGVACMEKNLSWVRENIFNHPALLEARTSLENLYYNKREALLHGDLHTGSIMIDQTNTYFIDPEFARIGPISFDIGMLIANLIISLLAANYHIKNETARFAFQQWLHECIHQIFNETIKTLSQKGFDHETLSNEIIGFSGVEIIRRTIGLAQIKDLTSIEDTQQRAAIEKQALNIATQQVLGYQNGNVTLPETKDDWLNDQRSLMPIGYDEKVNSHESH